MNFWYVLYITDWVLFIPTAGTVLYLGFFAIAALFNRHGNIPRSKQQNRFVIIIPDKRLFQSWGKPILSACSILQLFQTIKAK